MTITSYGYAGTFAPAPVWAKMQRTLNHLWFINDANDFLVTANTGAVRTVTVATGVGGGGGIYNSSDTPIDVPLDNPGTGTKWWLISLREDMAGHTTTVAAIDCGTNKYAAHSTAVPLPTLQRNDAGLWDIPLALVEVSAGSTTPTTIIDLRLIGLHSGSYIAADENVLQYAVSAGIQINIAGKMWRRVLSGTSSQAWQTEFVDVAPVLYSGANVVDSPGTGFAATGVLQEVWSDNGQVDLYIELRRTGAALAFSDIQGAVNDTKLCTLDAKVRPARPRTITGNYRTPSGGASYGCTIRIEPGGDVTLVAGAPNTSLRKSVDSSSWDISFSESYNTRRA